MAPPLSSQHAFLFTFFYVCLLLFAGKSFGQAPTPPPEPITDPSEAQVLNSLFASWGISSSTSVTIKWNTSITSGPCSGAANGSGSLSDSNFNPGIMCNCSFTSGNRSICHITELKAAMLYFKGTIPGDIKNLTYLTKLNLQGNSLSGIIPKELGDLKNLVSLEIGMNSFNGSLPMELGNLINLQKIRLDSLGLGVTGEIPPTFAKLQKLQVLWASDNNFTGRIPDFIGSFTELTDLRLHGNSFQGPIPSSFSNLTKLAYLSIGELLDGSSNLSFVMGMNSLKTLILRNSNISGTIPFIGSLTNLGLLDLSFNKLVGSLPQYLFNLPSLNYLFLGNNSLSGVLPSKKITSLTAIDLSYNVLSGSFPSWISDENLSLNLVGNNFFNNSNISSLPGLRCLQSDFPCNRGSPIQSSFAINCGSNQPVNVLNEPPYETDGTTLGAASYYVSGLRWAVSNVGLFADVSNSTYIQSISSRFPNTQNSELFQGTRLSPSSLRYYGLGLENGIYNVKLQFGETDNWKPSGRRFFDIYIQGIRQAKDFNIFMEAGTTLAAVEKNYRITVDNNFLEIHFFWAGKGTCCIPVNGTYGPSISAISVTPNFSNQASQSASKKKSTSVIVGILVPVTLCFALIFGIIIWRKKRGQHTMSDDEELLGLTAKPDIFSYIELRTATKDFNETNKLGEGGFGPVYRGTLSDGREIAVKKLSVASVEGKKQFVTEIATISSVQHRNLVKLYGCCCERDKRLLVYEYLSNRSLDKVLFRKGNLYLDWPARFKICLGTARGLAYLHEESSQHIVHRDVKASNILLDTDLNPKVSDFGLAKLRDETKTHITTGVAGTIGYLAPEYAMRGQLTEKADVFGFGVVVLEIVCGRKNTDPSLGAERMYLLEWAWRLREERHELEMIDATLSSYNEEEVIRVIGVAFLCTQASPNRRPSMSRVVAMLVGDMDVNEAVVKPSYLMEWRNTEASSSLTTGYSSTATTSGKDELNAENFIVVPSPLSTTQAMLGIGGR